MNRKREVLMDADIIPPDVPRVAIGRFKSGHAALAFQTPIRTILIELHSCHQLSLAALMSFPAAHVMAARDDAGLDAFGHPRAHDEITNLSFHAHEIASAHAEFRRMTRMQP